MYHMALIQTEATARDCYGHCGGLQQPRLRKLPSPPMLFADRKDAACSPCRHSAPHGSSSPHQEVGQPTKIEDEENHRDSGDSSQNVSHLQHPQLFKTAQISSNRDHNALSKAIVDGRNPGRPHIYYTTMIHRSCRVSIINSTLRGCWLALGLGRFGTAWNRGLIA